MSRSQFIQTNFTSGEVSPRLQSRVDLAKYKNGAEIMEGMYPLVHGGANRCPGQPFVAETKNSAKRSRLIPFVFSSSQAYQLEWGDLYMRVFKDNGQVESAPTVPYEIVTPYAEADLTDLNYVQSADTAFMVHPTYPVRRLTRSGHAAWKLGVYPFIVEPHDEVGTKPASNVTLGAVTGTGISATAASAVFEPADVGRQITSGDGVATIVGYTSTTIVTVDISDDFSAVLLTSGNWTLTESPKTTLTPSVAGPEGAAITLTLTAAGWKSAPTTDVGRYVHINGGVVEITGFTSNLIVSGKVRSVLTGTTAAPSGSWSMETKIWNATNGYPRAAFLFQQRLILAGTTAFPNRVWGSRTARYNDFTTGGLDTDGLDFDLVSDQQNPIQQVSALKRALLPLTYGGEFSVTGGVEKPLAGTNVQASPETQYGIKNVRPVRVGNEILFVQRSGRKIRAAGYKVDQDAYGSPDLTILSEHITEGGITEMAYAQEPDSTLWSVRADGQAVAMAISREQEVVGFGRRVTKGLYESFSSIPYLDTDQVWCIVNRTIGGATKRFVERLDPTVNTDSCLTGSFDPIEITAISWLAGTVTVTTLTAHGLGVGSSVRIAGCDPAGYNRDFMCTAGTAGTTINYALETDPGAATTLGTATPLAAVWAGFDHLEGEALDVLADGVVFPAATVTGGQITLPRPVATIEAGLHYQSRLRPLTLEVALQGTTAQGCQISVSTIIAKLYKSYGGTIKTFNDEGVEQSSEDLPFRRFGLGAIGQPFVPYTGNKRVNTLGWGETWKAELQQNQPLPFCVLALMGKVTVND